jgi:SAM-dependent methyltransferase
MNSLEDAHGQVIFKYYNNERSFDVVEREDGFINIDEGAELYFADFKDWYRHEKDAIKFAKGKCLDIGCGAGRVLLHLQKKGFYVLGIDSSPMAIKICKLRGVRRAKVMSIEDIGKFKKNFFDTIIMFGRNFGLFGNRKKARTLLKKLYDITSEEALIIAETREPYITDNPVHFKYHRFNKKRGRMPGQLRIKIRFMQYATPWYDYLYVSKNEMKDILKSTGWKIHKFIDSEDYAKNGLYIALIGKE